ncbi:MAG: hypothetical protein R2684_03760 [Pyrinomonadaceae bacterium]
MNLFAAIVLFLFGFGANLFAQTNADITGTWTDLLPMVVPSFSIKSGFSKSKTRSSFPSPGQSIRIPKLNLTGIWTVHFSDGVVGKIPMKITQIGNAFQFETGIGDNKANGKIDGTSITTDDLKGDVSSDGRVVRFQNGLLWVRNCE